MRRLSADFLVVGGGVAGVCCVEELVSLFDDHQFKNEDKNGEMGEEGESEAGPSGRVEHSQVVLVSGHSGYVKVVTNAEKLGQIAESFQVGEKRADHLASRHVRVLQDDVSDWDSTKKEVGLSDGRTRIRYGKLCIATGARPNRSIPTASHNLTDAVLTLRDVDSVARLRAKISRGARRVILVGNGGIATELVFELEGVQEVIWAIRHSTISATYFDEAAAKFFEPKIASGRRGESTEKPEAKLARFTVFTQQKQQQAITTTQRCDDAVRETTKSHSGRVIGGECEGAENGCALGPHWLAKLVGQEGDLQRISERKVRVVRDAEVRRLFSADELREKIAKDEPPRAVSSSGEAWPVWAELSSDEVVGADFVIEATGVTPNSQLWAAHSQQLKIAKDGGILVDEMLRTTVPDVFAAGDVCTVVDGNDSIGARDRPHWMQIRLWTQARQMGIFCARSMAVKNVLPDICFDLFTHVTTFFGYKVVLLGDFSAAKLEKPYELHYRIQPAGTFSRASTNKSISAARINDNNEKKGENDENDNGEYVKVIVKNSCVHGAVLIGPTDLEETMENLILNQTDISAIESDLLSPDIDLEDYFD